MPIYVGEFVSKLAEFIDEEIPREVIRRQIDTAIYMWSRFREYTPKPGMSPAAPYSSGHAVLNWMMSIDYLTTNENGERLGNGWGNTTAKNFTETYYRNLFSVRSSTGKLKYFMGTKQLGFGNKGRASTVYVYNNVKYMQFLIDGNSKAAPQGWFDLVLEETKDYMARKAKK